MRDFNTVWQQSLYEILNDGHLVSPRGKLTREIANRVMTIDMRKPVLTIAERKLSYQFMGAEAYWILSGDDTVKGISPYNSHIANFSDDGKRFFGAYGPKIVSQLDYVVAKLKSDPDTRQAGLTIWRENPPETKDVPCTVAVFFSLRKDSLGHRALNCYVFMRSSDVWLGVPYDVFNFSMLSHFVCGHLNAETKGVGEYYYPGHLYLTAASSHLYETNWTQARDCLSSANKDQQEVPEELYIDPVHLMSVLKRLRDTKPGDSLRWWEAQ